MDIANTVYALTVGIINFISEHEDKNSLKEQIANVAIQIQGVIAPLLLKNIQSEPLRRVLEGLRRVLATVEEHLRSWQESRARRLQALVYPWAVTAELRDDKGQLMDQYIMLMGAMQVVDHIRGYNMLPSVVEPDPSQNPSQGVGVEAHEVVKFWRSHIGDDVGVLP